MRDEYQMRAELLLKRLDVTIQSFTWSDRVHQKENDLFAVYRPLRAALRSESVVTVAHILAARAGKRCACGAALHCYFRPCPR
jgi:hypothetical protein